MEPALTQRKEEKMAADTHALWTLFASRIGPGFRFISRIISVDPEKGEILAGFRYWPDNDPDKHYLSDHFLGDQKLPMTVVIEMMAQTAGLLMAACDSSGSCNLVKVKTCRMNSEVRPPTFLQFAAKRLASRHGFEWVHVWVRSAPNNEENGQLVAEGELVLQRRL